MEYWRIFWRTFAQLMLAVVGAAQAMDWATGSATFNQNADKLAVLTLVAFIGAVLAAGYAFVRSPATSALQKGLRSAGETILGGLSAVVVNELADVVKLEALVIPLVVATVLAFLFTYFQYQPPATAAQAAD
jgi:hypothetical protein